MKQRKLMTVFTGLFAFLDACFIFFFKCILMKKPLSLPCVGNGLPADWRDELDGELLLLRINVTFICSMTEQQ